MIRGAGVLLGWAATVVAFVAMLAMLFAQAPVVSAIFTVLLVGVVITGALYHVHTMRSLVRELRAQINRADSEAVAIPSPMSDQEWTPLLTNGVNSRQMMPREQLLNLAGRAVREMRPSTPPTQTNLCDALGIGGGTASAIQGVLRDWGVADVRDGVPSMWI